MKPLKIIGWTVLIALFIAAIIFITCPDLMCSIINCPGR